MGQGDRGHAHQLTESAVGGFSVTARKRSTPASVAPDTTARMPSAQRGPSALVTAPAASDHTGRKPRWAIANNDITLPRYLSGDISCSVELRTGTLNENPTPMTAAQSVATGTNVVLPSATAPITVNPKAHSNIRNPPMR